MFGLGWLIRRVGTVLVHTGCFIKNDTKVTVTALVLYHLESYGISAFLTDNGTF